MKKNDFENLLMQGAIAPAGLGKLAVGWGEAMWSADPTAGKANFYVPDFFLTSTKPWLSFSEIKILSRDGFAKELEQLVFDEAPPRSFTSPEELDFLGQFQTIQVEFKNENLKKAVPVVWAQSQGEFTPSERLWALRRSMLVSKSLMPYGFWLGNNIGLLGVTPELLFEFDSNKKILTSMALAGTRLTRGAGNLLDDPKEIYEHTLVVEAIAQKLSTLGTPTVSEPYEHNVGHLTHIRTDICVGVTESPNFVELVDLLHPTPALGLAPSSVDFHWLKKLEGKVPREHFGAPFGYIDVNGDWHCVVAIRNVQWREGATFLGAGCGIVPQSDPKKEWQELLHKQTAVKEILGL